MLFNPYTIYQNKYDSRDLGIEKRSICIEGSSVNEDKYNLEHASINQKYISSLVEELDIDKTAKTFLFVSRLIKEKGILELVESIININLNNTKVNLIIAGWSDAQNPSAIKTSYFKTLSEKYNFIKFLGKRSDVNDLIALSDVSILPTYLREGTPRFLLESMAMGKPIITTEMPGCDHLISKSKNGIMVKQKSVKEIEDSIIKILGKDIISMGQESYNFYKKKFSEKVVYSSIEKLYRSIL